MNLLFFFFIAIAVLFSAWAQLGWVPGPDSVAPLDALTVGAMDAAKLSVNLSLGLIGGMAFFLGLVKVAEAGGLLGILAKLIRPLMVWLFPDVPPNHPAMGAMILNMSANALGLGNAATPFGIRAMQELDKLNAEKGTATNAMALFLAINTSSVTLLPTGAMIWRQNLGSTDMAGIVPTTLFATVFSTSAAIIVAKTFSRFTKAPAVLAADPVSDPAPSDVVAEVTPVDPVTIGAWVAIGLGYLTIVGAAMTSSVAAFPMGAGLLLGGACVARWRAPEGRNDDAMQTTDAGAFPGWVTALAMLGMLATIPLMILYGGQISPWIVPLIITGFLGFGFARGVAVYEVFVRGAKEGFEIAVMIIPYLVAILVSIGMLRASGALEAFTSTVGPYSSMVGLPAEALPMAVMRPLSGSGANGIMVEAMTASGPDSYVGYLVSTLQGSTETTFYVIAVYFGAVNIRRIRHTLVAALTADVVGVIAAVFICSMLYGAS